MRTSRSRRVRGDRPALLGRSRGLHQIVILGVLMMLVGLASDIGYGLPGGLLSRVLSRRPGF